LNRYGLEKKTTVVIFLTHSRPVIWECGCRIVILCVQLTCFSVVNDWFLYVENASENFWTRKCVVNVF